MKKEENKKHFFDGKWLTIIILIIVIFILLAFIYSTYNSNTENLRGFLFDNVFWSIAISLSVSLSFTFFQGKLCHNDYGEIVEVINKALSANNQEISNYFGKYSPMKTYPSSNTPIVDFNNEFDKAFCTTLSYKYMGDRGEYLAFRLDKLKDQQRDSNRGIDIEILLPDITVDDFVTARIDSLKRKEKYIKIENQDKLVKAVVRDYKICIIKSLLSYSKLKSYYQFKICFYKDIPFIRYEIVDNVLVISLLTMDANMKYPPTFIYSKESAYYSAFSQHHYDMLKLNNSFEFTNQNLTRETILEYARKAGLDNRDLEGL